MNPEGVADKEVIDWLLSEDNPSVRFWALQDLKDKTRTDPQVVSAQRAIMQSPCVKTILGAQKAEGYWGKKESMYLPKYTATTHTLLILAELGADSTPAIRRAFEFMFSFQRNSGHFGVTPPKTEKGKASTVTDGCCFDGNILYYLIHFGYLDDAHTKKLIDFLVGDHSSKDYGWRCRSYPINIAGVFPVNCYMGAVKVLKALSTIPMNKRSKDVHKIIEEETESILTNRVYKYLRGPKGERKDKEGWKRFGFPLFYQSDALEVLDVLTSLGVHDARMKDAIDLVEQARRPDGRCLLKNTYNSKMLCNIETKGQPSKWVTLRAMRVLKRWYEAGT
ncbi:MAG: nitrogen fixation protein NifH [Candidatus Thorarchaeota archaeon]|nr:MAG: nitrogen fixation protein NifH [Candidatus Thorarchaeota archaeon]